jgi:3-isopropylmalate/(R)-2-methylmalate dehydratase small subunit
LPAEAIDWLAGRVAADPSFPITVDLRGCEVRAAGQAWTFEVDTRARALLLAGRDEISETLDRETEIVAHETARAPWLPRVHRGGINGLAIRT